MSEPKKVVKKAPESPYLIVGKFSALKSSLKGLTKEDFTKQFGKALRRDTDVVWKEVKKFAK